MPRSEATPTMSPEDSADLDTFVMEAHREMRARLDHGAQKFGDPLGFRHGYSDGDNSQRLNRARGHLDVAVLRYREGAVGLDEVRKRAADVANQAFMLADAERLASDKP